jgi:hypothetical protein
MFRRLSNWDRQQQAIEDAEVRRLEYNIKPHNKDADFSDQDVAFDYVVIEISDYPPTIQTALKFWGSCGWYLRNLFRDTTALGHPTGKCMLILERRHNVPAAR